MKNKILKIVLKAIIIICIILVIILVINKLRANKELELDPNLPINYVYPSYAYTFATPEETVGIADYVFVAKVNSIKRTDYRNPVTKEVVADGSVTKTTYDPYTIYDITVIENIKGELIKNENIELEQRGGLEKDGKSYTFMENMGLLNVGEYYIILALASDTDGAIRIDHYNMVVPLGNINNEQEINLIKETSTLNSMESINNEKEKYSNLGYNSFEKVLEYKAAYLNEKVPGDKIERIISSKYDTSYQE